MRFRVSQSRFFRWARPAAVETEGELLREAVYDRLLYGAVYPRPARERRTAGGIVPEGGFALDAPPDCGLLPGDRLRPLNGPEACYEVTEVLACPAHLEAVLRLGGAEEGIQEAAHDGRS